MVSGPHYLHLIDLGSLGALIAECSGGFKAGDKEAIDGQFAREPKAGMKSELA